MRESICCFALSLVCLMASVSFADAQKARSSVSGAEVTGTFRMNFEGKFKTSSNDIKIQSLRGGKIHFSMDLLYPFTMKNGEAMANIGNLENEAPITGDTATYQSDDGKCTMIFKFVKPGILKVTQKQGGDFECGFGHNVTADGTYRKVSSKRPSFEEPNR